MTYPSGREIDYNYATGLLDDRISRLTSLSDSSGVLESYKYLGLGTVGERDHPQTGVNLSYILQVGEDKAHTDGGDKYTGLDRFGRVLDQNWWNPTTQQPTDRFQYGYDPDGNVQDRDNLVKDTFGELYHKSGAGQGYDGLNQLLAFSRGQLSASVAGGPLDTITSPSHTQSWLDANGNPTLDAVGNWTSVTTDGVTQTRTHNQQNEITSI